MAGSNIITYDQQWRPVTLYETGDTDALSVRGYRDLARNANVLKLHCTPWKICTTWKSGLSSGDAPVSEDYLCQFGPLPCPLPFTRIRWRVGGLRTGAGTYTVRVYSHALPYTGSWTGLQQVSSATLTTSHAYTGNITTMNAATELVPLDTIMPYTFLIVTGEASQSGMTATLRIFAAWPEPDEPT